MKPIDILRISTELQSAFIRVLGSSDKRGEMLDQLVERTADALNASACSLFTLDIGRKTATQRAGSGYQGRFSGKSDVRVLPANLVPEQPQPGEELGLTGWILSTGKAFLAHGPADVRRHPHHAGREQLPGEQIELESFLGVPVRGLEGEIIGCLKVERRVGDAAVTAEAFSDWDEFALETLARVAGRCIAYLGVAERGKESEAITAWARDVIREAASAEGELDSLLEIAVKVSAAAMGADSCAIFLKDKSEKTLTQRAGCGPSQELRQVIRASSWPEKQALEACHECENCHPPSCRNHHVLPREERVGLTAWIAATGRPFYAANCQELQAHCHHLGAFDRWNFPNEKHTVCGAFLGIPLRVAGTVMGVLKVENTCEEGATDTRGFSRDAWQRFELLGDDIALAIMRLDTLLPERYGIIQKAQNTIVEILRGGLEIPELVRNVVEETQELFHANACALFLREGDRLVQKAARGYAQRGPLREYDLVPPDAVREFPKTEEKVGLTVWMAVMQRSFTARSNLELKMHPHHLGKYDRYDFGEGEQCWSFMGFPLLIRQRDCTELVGVLKVENKTKKRRRTAQEGVEDISYFSELDERLCVLIANSLAIAVQNARLSESHAEADRALAASEAREKAWKDFSAMTAHRIGTEAANIRGATRWLRKDLAAVPEVRGAEENLTRIAEALKRVDAFVHEFTQFAKPPELKLELLNVNELCRLTKTHFAAEGADKIKVQLDLATDLPSHRGDREQLLYSFKEIFLNAAKAMPEGGELTVRTRTLGGPGRVRIEFVDTGPGVARELKRRIFEPGFRARQGGTGLGLALVQKTVLGHGGEIWEVGTPGHGAHFIIDLPLAEEKGTSHFLRQERVLVVDDTQDLCADIKRVILSDGFGRQVETASNESEAIRLISHKEFHVVITDVKLDEAGGSPTGGLDVLKAIKEKHSSTPVILVTAYREAIRSQDLPESWASMSPEEQAQQLGCFALIDRNDPKRDYLDLLRTVIDRALALQCKP